VSGPRPKPVLTGISYGSDYITLQFNQADGTPDSFTLGLSTAPFPHRLKLYGRDFEEEVGHVDVFFRFTDERGEQWSVTFACPVAEVDEITDALSTYLAAFKRQHYPKSSAAYIPYVVQQAAFSLGQAV
jgi:hypothetical protein